MADSDDEQMIEIGVDLARLYGAIAEACSALPVPIQLPGGIIEPSECLDSIRRVVDIVKDIPMPEEQQANLFAACLFWLTGMDLFRLQVLDPVPLRIHCLAAQLMSAEESVLPLIYWTRRQARREKRDQQDG